MGCLADAFFSVGVAQAVQGGEPKPIYRKKSTRSQDLHAKIRFYKTAKNKMYLGNRILNSFSEKVPKAHELVPTRIPVLNTSKRSPFRLIVIRKLNEFKFVN